MAGAKAKAAPASLGALRKQRQQQDLWSSRLPLALGLLVLLAGVLARALWPQPAVPLEEQPEYREALRVLRNDGLEASEESVAEAVALVKAATQPYDSWGFRQVDARRWRFGVGQRPAAVRTAQDEEGRQLALLGLAGAPDANVSLVEDFATEGEAAHLLELAKGVDFSTSPTKHSAGQDWRSSSSAILPAADPTVRALRRRAALLCGVPTDYAEELQVVRYLPGERYQPHLDSEGEHHRHWTLLLYLNDVAGGGATGFPLLRLAVLPAAGAAVFWENLRPSDAGLVRNYKTLHDGQPPTETKFAVNIWVRNAKYSAAAAAA